MLQDQPEVPGNVGVYRLMRLAVQPVRQILTRIELES